MVSAFTQRVSSIPLARRMAGVQPNAIGELLRFGADPALISFAGGYPDGTLFPAAELEQVFHSAIADSGRTALQYTVSDGDPKLRTLLATRIAGKGTPCTADQVLILQGSQQGLDLVAKLLVDPGDVIVTESPTFLGALIAFNPCEPRYEGIPVDADGMQTDVLEQRLTTGLRPKLVYVIPDFQNPTGATLSAERRRHLVALAQQYQFVILEDTAYRELRYRGEAPPTLRSLDSDGRVIMLGSFSKILAPGLRLGWAVGDTALMARLGLLKLAADTQCSTLNMAATALFMEQFDLDAHVERLKRAYAAKMAAMFDAIRAHFPQSVTFSQPDGGLFTWLSFPDGFDTEAFLRSDALPNAKVAYVPGASFFPVQAETRHARFNFSGQSAEAIHGGMEALGGLVKRKVAA